MYDGFWVVNEDFVDVYGEWIFVFGDVFVDV